MDDETLNALKESIEKWRKNETLPVSEARTHGTDCPLCDLAARRNRNSFSCDGCPVADRGHDECEGTYYYTARHYFFARDEEKFHEYSRLEREFLESLLPKDSE